MTQREIVLASLAASNGASHSPVQIQKLLFLIDRNISGHVEGPHFKFEPYDYGPFDSTVYSVVDELTFSGLIEAVESGRCWKKFRLTSEGQKIGNSLFESIEAPARKYIYDASKFVLSLSFAALVSAIYEAYPDMKVNSVFRG